MEPRALTEAEHKTLTLYAKGQTTEEIGERLSIDKSVVQDHLRVAVRKLGATNRVHAVAIAMDLKIIKIAPWAMSTKMWEDLNMSNDEERIRERAYLIWLREGKPRGCEKRHWLLAEMELEEEGTRQEPGTLPENKLFVADERSDD
jgi:DNA-binding CsgD family transcriptional regulator